MKLIDVIIPDPSSFFLVVGNHKVYMSRYNDINISFKPQVSFDANGERHETENPTITYNMALTAENANKLSDLFDSDFSQIIQTRETLAYINTFKFKVKVTVVPGRLHYNRSSDGSISMMIDFVKVELYLDKMGFEDFFKSIDTSYSKYIELQSDFISRFELMDI